MLMVCLLALDGPRRMPFAKAEACSARYESPPHATAVAERSAHATDGGTNQIELVLGERTDQNFVGEVLANDATLANHEPDDDAEEREHEQDPQRQHEHHQHARDRRGPVPQAVQETANM